MEICFVRVAGNGTNTITVKTDFSDKPGNISVAGGLSTMNRKENADIFLNGSAYSASGTLRTIGGVPLPPLSCVQEGEYVTITSPTMFVNGYFSFFALVKNQEEKEWIYQ